MISQGLIASIHRNAVDKGFWDTMGTLDEERGTGTVTIEGYDNLAFEFYAKQCMMLVSEVTELMESLRKRKGQAETEAEAADIFIRLADLYEGLRTHGLVDKELAKVIEEKALFNISRAPRHGVLG